VAGLFNAAGTAYAAPHRERHYLKYGWAGYSNIISDFMFSFFRRAVGQHGVYPSMSRFKLSMSLGGWVHGAKTSHHLVWIICFFGLYMLLYLVFVVIKAQLSLSLSH
jgi:hypothetical protein